MILIEQVRDGLGGLLPDAVATGAVLLVVQWSHRAMQRQQDAFAAALAAERAGREADRKAFREELRHVAQDERQTTTVVLEKVLERLDRLTETQRELAEAVARLSAHSVDR